VRPLSSALDAAQSSLTVQAPGADTAAAILAERFALPDSSGIQVIYAMPSTFWSSHMHTSHEHAGKYTELCLIVLSPDSHTLVNGQLQGYDRI